jgi:hypothetical protein
MLTTGSVWIRIGAEWSGEERREKFKQRKVPRVDFGKLSGSWLGSTFH